MLKSGDSKDGSRVDFDMSDSVTPVHEEELLGDVRLFYNLALFHLFWDSFASCADLTAIFQSDTLCYTCFSDLS